MMKNRRRRVSRANKKQDEEEIDNVNHGGEMVEEEHDVQPPSTASTKVDLVQQKPSKRVKTASEAASSLEISSSSAETTREWGSKQPKPADGDVLKYALTTGGELARKSNEYKTKTASIEKKGKRKGTDEETTGDIDEERTKAIEQESEEIVSLRNALFKEIKEGEASLSCDKRGSRVVQGLVKEGTSEQICSLFERLKPYVGHLIYDPFASHVVQSLIDRCGLETASKEEKHYVSDFAEQVNKANEWWAMMHDKSATHVARSMVTALSKINDETQLEGVLGSLKKSSQSDYRSAARNPNAGPFITAAILAFPKEEDRDSLVHRLFSDERNDVPVDRKQFDSGIQDRVASRVFDQVIPRCSIEFVHDVILEQGLVSPYLQRSAKHAFANFVVQRVLEKLSGNAEALSRVANECLVKDMIDFDRVGVITSFAKALSHQGDDSETLKGLRTSLVQELVSCNVLDRATQKLSQQPVVSDKDKDAKGEDVRAMKEANVHLALTELVCTVFTLFKSNEKQPLVHQMLTWEASRLVSLACDPVGGKKLVETVLESGDQEQAYSLAKRFKSHFAKLAMDKFGVHVAKKAFHLLKKNDKIACMEDDIVPGKTKLVGYPHGSKFLSFVAAAEFSANKKEWAKKMEAQTESESKAKDKRNKDSIKEEWAKELGI